MNENEAARLLGSRGGKASAARLTPEEREKRASDAVKVMWANLTPEQKSARARKAVAARWAKKESPRKP